MARSYEELVDKVLDWSNRDAEVFGTDVASGRARIGDFLLYAADKTYRTLRIPPLERTYTISPVAGDDAVENNRILIPPDLIEFIYVRGVNYYGEYDIVFNQKADIRTFHDSLSEKYTDFTWSRQGKYMVFLRDPGIEAGRTYEIFYYGRPAQLGSKYDDTEENYLLGVIKVDPTSTSDNYYDGVTNNYPGTTRVVDDVFNWLVHENERILLFGALGEAFTYLAEDDMAAKYLQLFATEIEELNREEKMRHTSGGNIQMNFNGRGLI